MVVEKRSPELAAASCQTNERHPGCEKLERSLDKSTSADRFYRIDRSQEHLHFVTEISQDEIFILDPELVATQSAGTPPGMPDLVVEQASGISDRWNPAVRKRMLSDSGLGKMSPHYEVPEKQKEASQTHMLQ
ncbi:UNVERIFIED_CONTAM: hypothetical protein K2H54_074962 [Gekko kuhli]